MDKAAGAFHDRIAAKYRIGAVQGKILKIFLDSVHQSYADKIPVCAKRSRPVWHEQP